MSRIKIAPSCGANAAPNGPANDARGAGFLIDGVSGRRRDWFIRVRSQRVARIDALESLILDGVATEAEIMEFDELTNERTFEQMAKTVAAFKSEIE